MAVAGNGNVYAAGGFSGTADFDPGPGVFNLTSDGSNDIFVSGLESNGDFGWAGGIGSWPQSPRAFGLAGDADGNAYVTGNFTETVDFDPSPGVFELSSGIRDSIFVCKLDSAGSFVWAGKIGGTGDATGYDLAVDDDGYVYTTGFFSGSTIDFDPGPGVFEMEGTDVFVSKLDSNGTFV